ncbi:unnamed protein product [Rotaria magnacalcarata]|uniref:SAM domain-containing protein n=1 Tax=Rotaria magnacalcarata TaxID=392030 RepID=A0A816UGS0_9BILA|nr:unnamed protein product [Rotaria magnacalcarata]CAF5046038.1 unnamed protein product [Rotaria magnacalcarata]
MLLLRIALKKTRDGLYECCASHRIKKLKHKTKVIRICLDDNFSFSQVTQRGNNHHRQINSSSSSTTNHRRSGSYELDPWSNKQIKTRAFIQGTKLAKSNVTRATLDVTQINFSEIKYCNQVQNKNDIDVHNKSDYIKYNSRVSSISHSHANTRERNISNEDIRGNYGLSTNPNKWTVFEVGKLISHLTDDTIANAFYKFGISGKALLLLTKEILRDDMNINLGPSLIILNEISKLHQHGQ